MIGRGVAARLFVAARVALIAGQFWTRANTRLHEVASLLAFNEACRLDWISQLAIASDSNFLFESIDPMAQLVDIRIRNTGFLKVELPFANARSHFVDDLHCRDRLQTEIGRSRQQVGH